MLLQLAVPILLSLCTGPVVGLFGVFANMALIINLFLVMGVLSGLQATLTLPGIAGIVLTVGMAVDEQLVGPDGAAHARVARRSGAHSAHREMGRSPSWFATLTHAPASISARRHARCLALAASSRGVW